MEFLNRFESYGDLGLHGVRLPELKIDPKYYEKYDISEDTDNYDFLLELCSVGFKKFKINEKPNKSDYVERGKTELAILKELGFVDYILLIWDMTNFANENGIAMGCGRGSAAGSLVLYLLGITQVDPIKHGLYFERFISKTRAKSTIVDGVTYFDGSLLPDIDTDFCYYRRKEVISYLENKYPDRVCKILTLNTLQGKLALKECAKICGEYSEEEANLFSSYIGKKFGKVDKLEKAEESGELGKWSKIEKEKYKFASNEKVLSIAKKIQGLPKNFGVHPSAIAVSHSPLANICPSQLTKDGELISAYDMNWVQEFAIKVDVLGLRTVSVINEVADSLGIELKDIDLDDASIYDPLQNLENPHGIFQIEANTQLRACREVKPNSLAEIADLMALARPGAIDYIEQYAKNKNSKVHNSIHKGIDEILKETKFVPLFQEQMMQIANRVFGLSLEDAESLRRVVGKKKVDEIPAWKDRIYEAAKQKNLDTGVADFYWKILEDSSNYSFNKSHAVSYGILAAWCLYLKFKYPEQFYLSLLRMTKHESDPHEEISKINRELSTFRIELLKPDLIKSDMDFSLDGKNIRFGLSSIKGVAEKSLESLKEFRGEYPNKLEMFEAAKKAKLNIGILSAIIQAGAMEIDDQSRSFTVLEAQVWNLLTDREKRYFLSYGEDYDFKVFDMLKDFAKTQKKDEKGKVAIIKESRFETIKNKSSKYVDIFKQNSQYEQLANWFFERKLLGYSYTSSLYDVIVKDTPKIKSIKEFYTLDNKDRASLCGLVTDIYKGKTRKGDPMFRMTIEDGTGEITCILMNDGYLNYVKDYTPSKRTNWPQKENLVVVSGSKINEAIFPRTTVVLDEKIFMKLSDLK